MKVEIKTDIDTVSHNIVGAEVATKDEICRVITALEIIKIDLIDGLFTDYEIRLNMKDIVDPVDPNNLPPLPKFDDFEDI